MQVQWSHSVLRVRDLEAMTAFYCDALGFQIADRGKLGPKTDIVFLSGSSTDHHQLGLMTGRDAPIEGLSDRTTQSLDHMAFRVESIEVVQQMITWVSNDDRVADGFPVTHGNAVSVYFSDPEGNGIEIFADTPWHVQQPQVEGWDPSQSTPQVLASVETKFKDTPGFKPREVYRSEQAATFGEGSAQ